jgi:hypothetical protein
LWLYATIDGVGSARQLERLAQHDLAYRWIAGGVPLNYHGLSDFRVMHIEVLDRLLTESVTALVAKGVVSLAEIAVDGTKVRAHASGGSGEGVCADTDRARRREACDARKLGFADRMFKNIKVENGAVSAEDILREINRGGWSTGYCGQSPERLKAHVRNQSKFDVVTLRTEGR